MAGLERLAVWILRIGRHGYVHLGTPCKSWIALSRAWSKRSMMAPQGPGRNRTNPKQWAYLQEHNAIGHITAYIVRTAHALDLSYTIEQPVSSLLFSFDPVLKALAATGFVTAAFTMGSFGGESPKPLLLKGSAPWLRTFREVALKRKAESTPPTKRLTTTTSSGFTGQKGDLDASSGYTCAFGVAVALACLGLGPDEVCAKLKRLGFPSVMLVSSLASKRWA